MFKMIVLSDIIVHFKMEGDVESQFGAESLGLRGFRGWCKV